MIFDFEKSRVFIYQQPVDMRAGFEKLSFFIREVFKEDLLGNHLFLFLGKNRRRLKVLFFDRSGLVLISKRLEGGKFMPIMDLCDVKELTLMELKFLLSGSHLRFPASRHVA